MNEHKIVTEWLRYAQNDLVMVKQAINEAQQVYDFTISYCQESEIK
jgi:hypothetical protein